MRLRRQLAEQLFVEGKADPQCAPGQAREESVVEASSVAEAVAPAVTVTLTEIGVVFFQPAWRVSATV